MGLETRKLKQIKLGDRIRKSISGIDALAESIDKVGLLQPIGIRKDNRLVCGERRIKAYAKLGRSDIPVYVCENLDDELRFLEAEGDENTCRESLTPIEALELAKQLKPKYAEQARQAQLAGKGADGSGGRGKKKNLSGTSTKVKQDDTKRAASRATAATGYSEKTLRKVAEIQDAAKADREKYGFLATLLAEPNCKVDQVYHKFQDIKRTEKEAAALKRIAAAKTIEEVVGSTKFSTIVVDPPWDWKDEGDVSQLGRGKTTYGALSIEQLLACDVGQFAERDAHLYLWITNRSLPKGFRLVDAWGFRYVTCLTWCKPSIGMGNYFRGSTEHILFGIRGSLKLKRSNIGTWFAARRGKQHSEKPNEFYDIVQSCSPGPYLDVFARKQRPGWIAWGGELE